MCLCMLMGNAGVQVRGIANNMDSVSHTHSRVSTCANGQGRRWGRSVIIRETGKGASLVVVTSYKGEDVDDGD